MNIFSGTRARLAFRPFVATSINVRRRRTPASSTRACSHRHRHLLLVSRFSLFGPLLTLTLPERRRLLLRVALLFCPDLGQTRTAGMNATSDASVPVWL
jgi:hypothetical protein